MRLLTDPKLPAELLQITQWLGITSIAGFLAISSAYLAFPPEIIIDGVVDKSRTFNPESKIKIKNIGRLPARNIQVDVLNLRAKFADIETNDCNILTPEIVPKLSFNESAEISIRIGIEISRAIPISELSYTLVIKHKAKLFFLRKEIIKKWKVELRNFEDGYAWDIAII